MNFIKLAQEAELSLAQEKAKLDKIKAELDEKSSAVARELALAVEDTKEVAKKKKELQAYEEEVTRKALSFKSNFDAKEERVAAAGDRVEAEKSRKEAKEHLDRSSQLLIELSKREIALSEREKTYKQDIENEVLRNIAFRK